MTGALRALYEAGLDPRSAETIVGTSAGAVLAGILATGHLPWEMDDRRRRPIFDIGPSTAVEGGRWRDLRPPLQLLRSSLLPPYNVGIPALVGGIMPAGALLTDNIQGLLSRHAEDCGALHKGVRIVAVDRSTGRRMVFGPKPAPRLPAAVAASCAIPGYFAPVRIAGRDYIDGGVHSVFNLDVAAEGKPGAIVVLSAMSGSVPLSFGPAWLAMRVLRGTIGMQLGREVRAARRAGSRVDVIEPSSDEVLAMGRDLMSGSDAQLAYKIGLLRTRKRLASERWREVVRTAAA